MMSSERFPLFYRHLVPVLLSIAFIPGQKCPAQDTAAFRAQSPEARRETILALPFAAMDSARESLALEDLLAVAAAQQDPKAIFLLQYRRYLDHTKLRMSVDALLALTDDMERLATRQRWEVETVVARHASLFEHYYAKQRPQEQVYMETLKSIQQMEALGFERFRDYRVESLLWSPIEFMYALEDYEKMFDYLSVAERYIRYDEEGQYYTNLVLNYLQTYYQHRNDRAKALEYARKILDFNRELVTTNAETAWRRQFWQGLALLDIARILIEQGQLAEGERYAGEGYALSKVSDPTRPFGAWRAEYDALQVLLSIKLKLGNLKEAGALIRRSEEIKRKLDTDPKLYLHYFKYLGFFNNCAQYYEMRGDYAASIRYTRMAQVLQDSLDRRNDARKYDQMQRRMEVEQYDAKLHTMQREKQLQQGLFYAACLIFVLTIALGYSRYRRLQSRRRQAATDLEALTRAFRDKSEMAERLNAEIRRLSDMGERSQYLEQLNNSTILTEADWTRFRDLFEKVHPGFIAGQKGLYPELTRAGLRVLVLEKLGLDAHEIANTLGISLNTVYKTRQRMRRKDSTLSINN